MTARKWTFCPQCSEKRWCLVLSQALVECERCQLEFDLYKAKKVAKTNRDARTKELGKKILLGHKEGPERDFAYMAWVRLQPCCVPLCKTRHPVHAHHAVHKSQQGTDRTCVPLCPFHHLVEYHGKFGSVEKAEEAWGINLIEVAKKMSQSYEKLSKKL